MKEEVVSAYLDTASSVNLLKTVPGQNNTVAYTADSSNRYFLRRAITPATDFFA